MTKSESSDNFLPSVELPRLPLLDKPFTGKLLAVALEKLLSLKKV
jgi:hypothetical protein